MSGIRVSPSFTVKSYQSILRCGEESLHWITRMVAYVSLISAQRNTGECQIRENLNLGKLRKLYCERESKLSMRSRQFLEYLLKIWSDPNTEEAVKPAHEYIRQYSQDSEPYLSDLLIRVRVFSSACAIILNNPAACAFLRAEEKLRIDRQRIDTPESVVMHMCLFDYTNDPE